MATAGTTSNSGPGGAARPAPEPADGVMRFTFASDVAHGRRVQQAILDAVEARDYAPDVQFAIRLALEEALTNAIRHGNKLDLDKSVTVTARVTDRQAEITVQDQGAGFERQEVPDPTAEENLGKCGGRGVLLIEAYMSETTWSDRGRHLHMIKRNASEAPSVPE